ncbi:hypothetical protein ASD89_16195 [Caulobacter sp. Root656]|nr:hypothetical protein ASD89_16195 [Caulobacter sp. Root656]
MRKIVLGVLLALVLAPLPAMAQGVFDMGALTNTLSQGALVQSETARAGTSQIFGPQAGAPPSQAVNRAALLYRPDMAARKRNMARIVERLRGVDPAGAADLQRTFASRDLIAEIGGAMGPQGLNPDNVADAVALYLVTAYYGVRGSTEGEPHEFKAVSAQVGRALSANPAFTSASDASKQEMAESMLVQAVLANQAVQAAQKQPSAMPAIKAAIDQGTRSSFGMDLTRVRLGPDGLR